MFTIKVLSWPESHKDLVTLISTGAILATFGSALSSLGKVLEGDMLERVHLNVDILYKDILHQETPWRRWPFLPRTAKRRMLDGTWHQTKLYNPEVPLDVGSHVIKIALPTVLEDFFDIPVFRNLWPLIRFRNSAHTVFGRKEKDEKNPETGMLPANEYMAYECMLDIWKSIFQFRVARYIVHFGAALTLSSAVITAIQVVSKAY
jgi:hypothetical protein